MTSPAKPPLLKIVAGPHSGAELVLVESEYRIGRSPDCDVVLSDPQVAEQHVRLTIADGRLLVAALADAPLLLEGEPVTETELEAFQFLTLGNTTLTCGPQDAEWPHRDVVTTPVTAAAATAPPTTLSTEATDEQTQTPESEPQPAAAETEPAEQRPSAAKRRPVLIVSVLVALAGCAALAFLVSGALADTAEPPPQTSLSDLDAIVQQIAPESSVVITEEDNRFIATGCVHRKSVADELETALQQVTADIDTTGIRDAETIATRIRGFLRMRNLNELSVSDAEHPGHIIVSGITQAVSEWEKARADIESKTHVIALINHVNREFAQVAKPVTEPEPVAEPVVDEEPETEVAASEPPAVVEDPVPTPAFVRQPEKTNGLPFRIIDVSIGRRSFFTTDGGARIFVNAVIRGHKVVSISDGVIVFDRDGQEVIVRTRA